MSEQKYNHSDEEKKEIAERICEIYSTQRVTVSSACQAVGINERTFRVWRENNSDIAALWKKARASMQESYWEDTLKPLAESAFEKLLKGQTVYLKHTEGKETINKNGEKEFLITRQTVTEKHYLPHPSVVIFAMKLMNPELVAALGENQVSGSISDASGGKIEFRLVGPDRHEDEDIPT